MNLLFVCGRNRSRSPTAERLFAEVDEVQVRSAGVSPDADEPLTADLIERADVVFVMENSHRSRLLRMFGPRLRGKRVVCLGITDDYGFMDPRLAKLLWDRVPRSVPALAPFRPVS
jgi:predicted protein tyrosine phosphatase